MLEINENNLDCWGRKETPTEDEWLDHDGTVTDENILNVNRSVLGAKLNVSTCTRFED